MGQASTVGSARVAWHDALGRVEEAGICPLGHEHYQLAEMAATGVLRATSRFATVNGEPKAGFEIPVGAWEAVVRHRGGAHLDRDSGKLTCSYLLPGGTRSATLSAVLIEFDRQQLDELAPASSGVQEISNLPRKGRGLSEHWPLFVAELALWIEEANDDPAMFTPSKLIAKLNERLAEKGIDEMPPTTADATIKAVLSALQRDA